MARVAMILDNMFEDKEFQVPYDRLREAGHEAVIVGGALALRVQRARAEDSGQPWSKAAREVKQAVPDTDGRLPDHLVRRRRRHRRTSRTTAIQAGMGTRRA